MKNRKCKVLVVDERNMIDVLTGKMEITNIPEGSEIKHVNYSMVMCGFEILIENESFEDVKLGQMFDQIWAEVKEIKTVTMFNKKTGDEYKVSDESIINATNANKGQAMRLYKDLSGQKFVRAIDEFVMKFEIEKLIETESIDSEPLKLLGHGIIKCKGCGKTITQCRCMKCDKKVSYDWCDDCRTRD